MPVWPAFSSAAFDLAGVESHTATSVVFSRRGSTRTCVVPTVFVPITAHRQRLPMRINSVVPFDRTMQITGQVLSWHGLAARGPGRTKTWRRVGVEIPRFAVEAFSSTFVKEIPPRRELVFPHTHPSPI